MMELKMKPDAIERLKSFLEDNRKSAMIVGYGITTFGLCVALYRTKSFAKFKSPSDIPSSYINKRIPLHGTVMRIEPSCGTLLMVNHKPVITLPRLTKQKYLPVKLAGVNVTVNGMSWLQTVVCGKQITFIPLAKEKEYVECIVTMPQRNGGHIKIAEELTKLGFATLSDAPLKVQKDKHISLYQKSLMMAERWAKYKRNGYWQFIRPPTLLWKIQMALSRQINATLPTFITRRLNI